VLGGAIDSGVDTLTTLLSLGLTRVAAREPDEDHPYGHTKFEAIGALAIVAFLSITVFELVQGAVGRLLADHEPRVDAGMALWTMAAALVVGWVVSDYERRRGRELESEVLRADAAHLRADVYVTLAILLGLGLAQLGLPRADAWVTLVVAFLIAHTGWGIVLETVPVLVDQRAVEEARVRDLAEECTGVRAVYAVRSRGRPGAVFAELTIAVDAWLDVQEGHEIADSVERILTEKLGAREVVVHVEPLQPEDVEGRG